MYVDDTKIYRRINNKEDMELLQGGIDGMNYRFDRPVGTLRKT